MFFLFFFFILHRLTEQLVGGSAGSEQTDESENAPEGETTIVKSIGGDGYTEGIPGPVTRLFVLANRGLANLIQDLILVSTRLPCRFTQLPLCVSLNHFVFHIYVLIPLYSIANRTNKWTSCQLQSSINHITDLNNRKLPKNKLMPNNTHINTNACAHAHISAYK